MYCVAAEAGSKKHILYFHKNIIILIVPNLTYLQRPLKLVCDCSRNDKYVKPYKNITIK